MAMTHLEHLGIIKLSEQLGAGNISKHILNVALEPFRWDITLSAPPPDTAIAGDSRPHTATKSGSVVNATGHVVGTAPSRWLPTVSSLLTPDQMNSNGQDPLVPEAHSCGSESVCHGAALEVGRGHGELQSKSGVSRGLESQEEALDPHRKRRRVNSPHLSNEDEVSTETATESTLSVHSPTGNAPSFDSSLRPSSGTISDQGSVVEETIPEYAGLSMAQAESDNQDQGGRMNIAMTAKVDQLLPILGQYLFNGMDTSRTRRQEKDIGWISFTNTVLLHISDNKGDDYKLELWVCSSVGRAILQAKTRAVEDLKDMLGGYLFNAMKTSKLMKKEEERGLLKGTDAFEVSFQDASDCKVEVMLSYRAGQYVWAELYPLVD